MITRKAPQTHATLSAIGISALLLGVGCGTAFASTTENLAACDALEKHNAASLREILDNDAPAVAIIRTVDASDSLAPTAVANTTADDGTAEHKEGLDSDESTGAPVSTITTRLPGVPDSDLPRFRRQMFRTDI